MTLALNYLISGLLILTILYCFKLSRKIDNLRQGKEEFANLIKHFDQSIVRAEHNIAELKNHTQKAGNKLTTKMEEANIVLDNLQYISEEVSKLLQAIDKKVNSPAVKRQLAHNNATQIDHNLTDMKPDQKKEMVNAILNKSGDEKTRVLQSLMERIADTEKNEESKKAPLSRPSNENMHDADRERFMKALDDIYSKRKLQ